VVQKILPGDVGLIPVVDASGMLIGIVEAHDLLRIEPLDHHFKMRELARPDFVIAYPGESVDQVHRDMMLKNVENVVVVESGRSLKPVGIVRANDILQLRRWLLEEEAGDPRRTTQNTPEERAGTTGNKAHKGTKRQRRKAT
jgi:signal-transduction protein with cAMP-binding, CBS, and nucleotidyltransferase domain